MNINTLKLILQKIVMLIIVALPALTTAAGVDNIRFRHVSIFDDMPNNTINAIAQDGTGYMWFGTTDGLVRYDGSELLNFTHNDDDKSSLSHNVVNVIFGDTLNNDLWVFTERRNAVSRFDSSSEQFSHYTLKKNTMSHPSFLSTSKGDLLIGHIGGIERFNRAKDRFESYIANTPNGHSVVDMVEDGDGVLWIATYGGLSCYDIDKMECVNSKMNLIWKNLADNKFKLLFSDIKRNRVWCITRDDDVYIYNTCSRRCRHLELPDVGVISSIAAGQDGDVWVGSKEGVCIVGTDLSIRARYWQDASKIDGLSDNAVMCIYKDKQSHMWLGTYFGGVNYFINNSNDFSIYPQDNTKYGMGGKVVRKIQNISDDKLLIATEDGGINLLSLTSNEVTKFRTINQKLRLKSKNAHSLLLDHHNNLFVGMLNEPLRIFSKGGNELKRNFDDVTNKLAGTFSMMEDSKGAVWCAGPYGVRRFVPGADPAWVNNMESIITKTFMYSLAEDAEGNIWAGGKTGGLFKISWNDATQRYDYRQIEHTSGMFVCYLYRDNSDRIWVATDHNGANIIDSDGNFVERYNRDNIGTNSIKSVIEDEFGTIWLATNRGLKSIDNQGVIDSYTTSDGLPINQMNYASAYCAPDGRLFFGTINGLISFDPAKLHKTDRHFNTKITNLWLDGERYNINEIEQNRARAKKSTDDLVLDYTDAQFMRLEYSGFNYRYGNNTQYAIKMEGVDSKWQYVGTQNQVSFSKLRAGQYKFLVKASADGVDWDEAGASTLSIRVLPPLYLSTFAVLIYILLAIGILVIIYYYTRSRFLLNMQLKTAQEQKLNIERLNYMKTNFFAFVSHDLKTPLTMIISPLQRILRQESLTLEDKPKLDLIYKNTKRMKFIIDELLTFSKIEMNQMKIMVRQGDIMNFLSEMSHLFDIVAEDREIDYTITIEDRNDDVWFSPSKLERIMYNILSNAFKYTEDGGKVSLSARFVEREERLFVEISVSDSGRGIPADKVDTIFETYGQVETDDQRKGFGLGLSLTRSLVNIHKGTISVNSEVGKGSTFVIAIDVSESSYDAEQRRSERLSERDVPEYNKYITENENLVPLRQDFNNDQAPSKDKPTILIVEDNIEMNDYLNEIFREKYSVLRAYDGVEALGCCHDNVIDVVVSDVMMPNMGGVEFVAKMKQNIETSHIPIILLTAKTGAKDFTEGLEAGADAYIPKPFDAEHLFLMVSNIHVTRRNNYLHLKKAGFVDVNEITSNSQDEKFMTELLDVIHRNMSDENFGISELIASMRVSRTLIHTKLKTLTGVSTTQFIRSIKMKEAKRFLQEGKNVSETSFSVGISDPNYFTKCFKKEFDITPSEYIQQLSSEK